MCYGVDNCTLTNEDQRRKVNPQMEFFEIDITPTSMFECLLNKYKHNKMQKLNENYTIFVH